MNSNNQMIQKGKISSVEGKADRNGDKTTARVLPSTADSMVTRPLTIPWYLRGEMGNLTPGTEVAYAMFEDGTGIILSRMDGEWDGIRVFVIYKLSRHFNGFPNIITGNVHHIIDFGIYHCTAKPCEVNINTVCALRWFRGCRLRLRFLF